jgi:hypothetical protein
MPSYSPYSAYLRAPLQLIVAGSVLLRRKSVSVIVLAAIVVFAAGIPASSAAGQKRFVIAISVDGVGSSYLQALIAKGILPNFRRFQKEGAWTNNARSDHDFTDTLPNHVTMVTGRGVYGHGGNGHMWSENVEPSGDRRPPAYSIHKAKGCYVASVFDVAHSHGVGTALYVTKSKFVLFDNSYNDVVDRVGAGGSDNSSVGPGSRKIIDTYFYAADSATVVARFIAAMKTAPFGVTFIHLNDADAAGHSSGWGSEEYGRALVLLDGYLGQIFDLVSHSTVLKGATHIILTADHGGKGRNHGDNEDAASYTVPFYVWGPDAQKGADLYSLNGHTRVDPGGARLPYSAHPQPIRNGDLANLALLQLGLGPVPRSTINASQDLSIASLPSSSHHHRRSLKTHGSSPTTSTQRP